jgi:branched-chain amino acid transport system permease protein
MGNTVAAQIGLVLMLLPLALLGLDWAMSRAKLGNTLRIGIAAVFSAAWVASVFLDNGGPLSAILGAVFPQGLSYWWALILGPIVVGASGILLERLMIAQLYKLDHLYGLLLTFGIGLIIEGIFRNEFGSSGLPYRIPAELSGAWDLGFMFMPIYRGWVVVAALILCVVTWLMIEKTRLGAYLRAATERAELVQAFGVNVPRMITLTYGFGVALAAIGGVLAAPIYSVNPQMGTNLIIVVFAVVVIGGMGSIMGAILTGFGLGVVEGLTKVFWPEASATVIFVIMAIVLLTRPAGLFGRA